ncbi:MAG: glycosyltransferase [Clostridium sp.]|nr:MAG: glycosyltransferase [Clostridium sp.]
MNFYIKINYNKPEHIVIKEHEEISSPKLSIVLPTYNVEKYIEDCILSIINQTLEEIEIIFVNDLGNDESINIIKKYMQYDKKNKKIVNNKQKYGCRTFKK